MSVHFQFNHSKCNQDLQTIHFHLLNLHNRFSVFFFLFCWEGNIFLNQLNWKWSEISPEFRIAEATNEKKKQKKLLILNTNCSFFNLHLNWQLWNIHIKKTAVYKTKTKKNLLRSRLCLIILPLRRFGRIYDLRLPQLFLEATEFTVAEEQPSQKKWRASMKKVLLYCSLGNSKTRAVYSLHGID